MTTDHVRKRFLIVALLFGLWDQFEYGFTASEKPALTELIESLKRGSTKERKKAALEFYNHNQLARGAISILVGALKDRDSEVRDLSAGALSHLQQEAVPSLLKALHDENALIRLGAVKALLWTDLKSEKAARLMMQLLNDKDPNVQIETIHYMMIKKDDRFVMKLASVLQTDKNQEVRLFAVNALCNYGPGAAPALSILFTVAQEGGEIGLDAQGAIAGFGASVIPILRGMLTKGNRKEQALALNVLAGIGSEASDAIPELTKFLNDHDGGLRANAAITLRKLGPQAKASIGALMSRLNDVSRRVRFEATHALISIDPRNEAILPRLIQDMQSDDEQFKISTISLVEELGVNGEAAVLALIQRLNDTSNSVRHATILALKSIGPGARGAVGRLIQLRNDPDVKIRTAANSAIRAIQSKRR